MEDKDKGMYIGVFSFISILVFMIGMAIGAHTESQDVGLSYSDNSIRTRDIMGDQVYIYQSSDTTHTIIHPKLIYKP